ncbi:hypothetical protein PILCRDRAFT_96969 [Piloderma croceum F 1598]|uniref:Cyclin N-terminal domain-containing protein n=1 Tax=Piloderma croceum (strain F 1598) TaxID=765440 RepID=A0A0C3BBT1_PILCF|nr:hypothetical protein PILCRDRAFT_96969 [Piloderma croceum F 1598]
MPVPVPRQSRLPAHPVFKRGNDIDNAKYSVFQQLTRTLPVSPVGPPPSFGTREEWINSLPSWRKLKPRRIWEDDSTRVSEGRGEQRFQEGLTGAVNASVIKGTHAKACIPPLFTFLQDSSFAPVVPQTDVRQACDEDADDEMSSDGSVMDQGQYDNGSQWSASSPAANNDDEMDVAQEPQYGVAEDRPGWHRDDGVVFEEPPYERGAFSPVCEDDSPQMVDGPDPASSPIGPTTPFGEFVDRAVAAAETYTSGGFLSSTEMIQHESHYQLADEAPNFDHQYQEEPKPVAPFLEPVVTPSTTINYKKLAEPLADWVASYVWKVCTTGMSLPADFVLDNPYPDTPPGYLAGSVHSLFLSTLLQPSAVLLALWYIARLPVFFGNVCLGTEQVKELRFRVELLGDAHGRMDRETLETNAPFRLVLLGCMLANKWLDDHTFSNKTWQSISNIPIESLNKLESLALDIFSHDLSTPPRAWSQWLTHLSEYHQSLSSATRPQPISRPSTNPHSIIRKTLEEIMHAPVGINSSIPEPVFLGLEERRRDKLELEEYAREDILEIDLDEDGPLREEYLPKRRVSHTGSVRSVKSGDTSDSKIRIRHADWENKDSKTVDTEKVLPPPAKWSPAADEPIFRERGRASGQYVAVQPPIAAAHFTVPLPPVYQQEIRYQNWPTSVSYIPVSQHLSAGYSYDPLSAQQPLPAYSPYSYVPSQSHSRSHSLSCELENCQPRNHFRSHSQTAFDYGCSIGMTGNEVAPPRQPDAQWATLAQYGCTAVYRQPFGPLPNVNYQSTWLRT